MKSLEDLETEQLISLHKDWGWVLVGGIISVILGFIALSVPVASSIGITFALAGIFIATGVINLIQVFKLHGARTRAVGLLQAIVPLVVGALMFRYPGEGMLTVALALSFYFFVSAALRWIVATTLELHRGWGMFSSIVAFCLGVYIIMTYPFSALVVPGIILGVDLMFAGFYLIGIAFAVRKLTGEGHAGGAHHPV